MTKAEALLILREAVRNYIEAKKLCDEASIEGDLLQQQYFLRKRGDAFAVLEELCP